LEELFGLFWCLMGLDDVGEEVSGVWRNVEYGEDIITETRRCGAIHVDQLFVAR
jgi:hypothetical protein